MIAKHESDIDPKYIAFIGLILAYLAILFQETFEFRPKSQTLPFLVIPTLAALLLFEIVVTARPDWFDFESNGVLNVDTDDATDPSDEEDQPAYERHKHQLEAIGWILGYILLIILLGFIPASGVFIFMYLDRKGEYSRKKAALITGGFLILLFVVFVLLLDTPFYAGIVRGSIRGAIVT